MRKDLSRKDLTEIVFILDRSGSMAGLEKDTIGGFNSMIEKQKKEPGEALISTVLFDHESEVIHDRVPLDKVPAMTEKEYYVRGCTALLDAVGNAVNYMKMVHRHTREEERPGKTLFVITTDGMENSSREFTYDQIKYIIEREKKVLGWEFIFLGANIDAAAEGSRMGISPSMTAEYCCDCGGISLNYEVLSDVVSSVRSCDGSVDPSWKKRIEEDFKSR